MKVNISVYPTDTSSNKKYNSQGPIADALYHPQKIFQLALSDQIHYQKVVCSALFITDKTWTQPRGPSVGE